jgi:hypothetical protein
MDDIEQKIEETKRELAELEQRKNDSAGQRINDCIAECNDRIAKCNDMLNTLLETGKKLEEAIQCFGGKGGFFDKRWYDVLSPELRDELIGKREDFSSLVEKVKTQPTFTVDSISMYSRDILNSSFLGGMLKGVF